MKKVWMAGGGLVLVVLAGWGGVHFLEDRAEKAVSQALSDMSAQASEVRCDLFSGTFVLKGVTYERDEKGMIHKGSMDSVEVKGLNRKLFFQGTGEAYDADALPLVAESIMVTGLTGSIRTGNVLVEGKTAGIRMTGWHQRLSELLAQYRSEPHSAAFYEELYRCRLDGLEISDAAFSIFESYMDAPVTVGVKKIALSEGIAAPRGEEKVPPVSLYASDIRFAGQGVGGGMQRVEVQDLLLPRPAGMAAFAALFGMSGSTMSRNELVTAYVRLAQKLYEERLPYASLDMRGMQVSAVGMPEPIGLSFDALTFEPSMNAEGAVREKVNCSGLHLYLPRKGDKYFTIIARYAPEGLVMNIKSDSTTHGDTLSSTGRYEVEGLGVLEGDVTVSGDIDRLRGMLFDASGDDSMQLLQKLSLGKLSLRYKDSGLMPMLLELAAWTDFELPEPYADMVVQTGMELEQTPVRVFQEAGRLLKEQFTAPGAWSATFTSEKPVSMMEPVTMLFAAPERLPFSFTSTPGTKPLKEYLPRKKQEDGNE